MLILCLSFGNWFTSSASPAAFTGKNKWPLWIIHGTCTPSWQQSGSPWTHCLVDIKITAMLGVYFVFSHCVFFILIRFGIWVMMKASEGQENQTLSRRRTPHSNLFSLSLSLCLIFVIIKLTITLFACMIKTEHITKKPFYNSNSKALKLLIYIQY